MILDAHYVDTHVYIYIIYIPNLGFVVAVSVWERKQGCFRGSSEGARGSNGGALRDDGRATGEHWRSKREHCGAAQGRSKWEPEMDPSALGLSYSLRLSETWAPPLSCRPLSPSTSLRVAATAFCLHLIYCRIATMMWGKGRYNYCWRQPNLIILTNLRSLYAGSVRSCGHPILLLHPRGKRYFRRDDCGAYHISFVHLEVCDSFCTGSDENDRKRTSKGETYVWPEVALYAQ